MIEIREISPPRKLSGLSSFLLKFPYNPQIVDVVKSFSPAVFDKKNLTWEISSSYLSETPHIQAVYLLVKKYYLF